MLELLHYSDIDLVKSKVKLNFLSLYMGKIIGRFRLETFLAVDLDRSAN